MSNIDKQALRDIAAAADSAPLWHAVGIFGEVVDPDNPEWKPVHDFWKTFTAERVLALLDELEAKDAQIANLTAERDALREGAMGDAKHSNTRAAADIYFQLVEECEIPPGGSLVDYVDDMREKLKVAEKRIAELSGEFFALPPLNDDLVSILGRPNFTCAHLAELLRKGGQDIRRKAEHEQAAVIYWFLDLYLKYGDKWESIAKDDIQARAAMLTAAAGKGE